VLHSLDLTDEQWTKIHSVIREHHAGEIETAVSAVGSARRALELLVWDASATDRDIEDAGAALSARQRELDALRHRMASEVLAVLTDEQRTTFRTQLAEAAEVADMPGPGPHPRHPAPGGGRPEARPETDR
jgi:Spy/CpxP family protein refolding chaperone